MAEFTPSWETDAGVEGGAPVGDVTEEQVRDWLLKNGLGQEEIENLLSQKKSAIDNKLDGGNVAPLFPGDRAGR